MESDAKGTELTTFDAIFTHLVTKHGYPVLAAASPYPYEKSLSHVIASLSVHPTLESILHLLNSDLPSAHFLCRHMQNKPAWEGMYIHGILHRIEGDYRNAEAWYKSVSDSDCFKSVWEKSAQPLEDATTFIRRVERLRKEKFGSLAALEQESKREIDRITLWCKDQYGLGEVNDATTVWVTPGDKHRQIAAKMIVGGEGWREF